MTSSLATAEREVFRTVLLRSAEVTGRDFLDVRAGVFGGVGRHGRARWTKHDAGARLKDVLSDLWRNEDPSCSGNKLDRHAMKAAGISFPAMTLRPRLARLRTARALFR